MDTHYLFREKARSLAEYRDRLGTWKVCTSRERSREQMLARNPDWRETKARSFPWQSDLDYWFTRELTIPSEVEGIDIAGTAIRLVSNIVGSPMRLYLNGKQVFYERFWADLRVPGILIAESAHPGDSCRIDIHVRNTPEKRNRDLNLALAIQIDCIEDILLELRSFPLELDFCRRFEALRERVNAAESGVIDGMVEGASWLDCLEAIHGARGLLAPAAEYTKSCTVHTVGHAHIDMNWLWTMEDTVEVCRRDFESMTSLLDENRDFRFSQSQGAVYEIAEKHFPELFSRISDHVAGGGWDPTTAATWTENDLNMSSGESIARHLLYTRRYLRQAFGATPSVCWEPDTFGHPGSMPQILRAAGVDSYFHMRCGRGHPLYLWEGIDGTRLLVANGTYNGTIDPERIFSSIVTMLDRCGLQDSMLVYGVGDHGGGPTRRDIEIARRLDAYPTTPKVRFSTPAAFFERIAPDCEDVDSPSIPTSLPVVRGELNPVFEGCYTSHADIKANNAACENNLISAEIVAALISLSGGDIDHVAFEENWKLLMFSQFHDILCGCAIASTHEQSRRELTGVLGFAEESVRQGLSRLSTGAGPAIPKGSSRVAVWNLHGSIRDDVASMEWPEMTEISAVVEADGLEIPWQRYDGRLYFMPRRIPSFGYRVIEIQTRPRADGAVEIGRADDADTGTAETDGSIRIQTDYYEIDIDRNSGCFFGFFDRQADRKLVQGRSWLANSAPSYQYNFRNNLFSVDYEIPAPMSAWVIGRIAETKNLYSDARVELLATGPVMDVVSIEHSVGDSTISQEVLFYRSLRRIDFSTIVDWQEESRGKDRSPMLRVTFTPELGPGKRFHCGIPFGAIERPTDGVESPCQDWIDMSDSEYGLSLMCSGKYGFRAGGSEMSMTCLRTSSHPDPIPDKGKHRFTYSLLPHTGTWQEANTPLEARSLARPLMPILLDGDEGPSPPAPKGPVSYSWFAVEGDSVTATCLKPAADGMGLILRLVESAGTARDLRVRLHETISEVWEISLTEDHRSRRVDIEDVHYAEGRSFEDNIGPFEIKTYLLLPSEP